MEGNMKGVKEVIDALNDVLASEIRASNQSFMHAKLAENRGFSALADRIRRESMEEMRHADAIIDRILFLEGVPDVQAQGTLNIGQTITQQAQNDLAHELQLISKLRSAIAVSRDKGDHTTAAMLEKILADEERHVSRLETQLSLIEKVGENAFLLTQIRVEAARAAHAAKAEEAEEADD
jgi:bacterioferritin